jgi:hypothetical protein
MLRDKTERLANLFKRQTALKETVKYFENPQIAEVFNNVENEIIHQLKSSSFNGEDAKRDALLAELRCIGKLRNNIVSVINQLTVVEHNIKEVDNGK